MAISSSTHRSLSPVSRNPQGSNGGPRRSFNGNPLARSSTSLSHVNSPSDSSRRSLNKEGFGEFKENEKKAKQGSIQRGTKGFMAPTISAISKKSPSPSTRKKILCERNEAVRSSVDLDESGFKSEMGFDYQVTHINPAFKPRALNYQPLEAEEDSLHLTESIATQPSTNLVLPDIESSDEPDPVSIASAGKTPNPRSPLPCPSAIAPLDSDPHLPPYDPKTNYLSPRPRFLHYKPRPRIEVYVQNEKGVDFVEEGKNLEESFSSESYSDTDETPFSGSSKEVSEDDYSSEMVSEEENPTPLVSQPKLVLDYTQRKRPMSSSRSKLIPFLLVFAIACLSFQVIDTPVFPQSASYQGGRTFSMDTTANLVGSVKGNFNHFSSNLKLWSSNMVSHLSMLMSVPRLVEGPLHFSNTTIFIDQEPLEYDEYCFQVEADTEQVGEVGREAEVVDEPVIGESEQEEKVVIEKQEALPTNDETVIGESEIHEPVDIQESSDLDNSVIAETSVELGVAATDTCSELDYPILTERDTKELDVIPQTSELDDSVLTQSPAESVSIELDVIAQTPELYDSALTQNPDSDFPFDIQDSEVSHRGLQLDDGLSQSPVLVSNEALDDNNVVTLGSLFSGQNVGIVLSAVAVAAATTYAHLKRRKATILKKMACRQSSVSCVGDSGEHGYCSPPKSSQVVMVDDSCFSEVSGSFKRSSPHDNTHSNGKRPRYAKRQALPSSSEYSYGSFTTYEKIHTKHGGCEEEVVTPVRRSSRIRQIISPEDIRIA